VKLGHADDDKPEPALQDKVSGARADRTKMLEVPMDIPGGWALSADGQALERSYRFKDFAQAFAFLTRIAAHAEAVDHHPEFTSVWNRVDIRLTSHDAGGVTARDVALAEVIDELAEKTSEISPQANE